VCAARRTRRKKSIFITTTTITGPELIHQPPICSIRGRLLLFCWRCCIEGVEKSPPAGSISARQCRRARARGALKPSSFHSRRAFNPQITGIGTNVAPQHTRTLILLLPCARCLFLYISSGGVKLIAAAAKRPPREATVDCLTLLNFFNKSVRVWHPGSKIDFPA
jgi:hypothetical protein